ncbi:MAG: T9SS type A sorting domain-containing protein [Bacteroidia bacterium]|nr:T9SS type A sorting domain-containing protein [Bacteroidia bacterium]
MKTKIFTILIICMLFAAVSFSQPITNASFENWSIVTLYEEPGNYITTNLQAYFTQGSGNITKSTDCQHGVYAARLQTISGGSGAVFGGLFIGTPGPGGISGGLPYDQRPTSLQGYVKYDIQTGDTANIMIIMKKAGSMIGGASIVFTGVQSSYIMFTTAFTWYVPTVMPDTITAIITSSKFNGPIAGSYLYIDNLTLVGATTPFPNGDFENWIPLQYENPDNWFTINFIGALSGDYSATKTTDHYGAGNYALKLKTVTFPNGSSTDTMGYITNGRMGNNGPRGGMAVTQNPMRVSGYYKYIPVGQDTALMGVYVFGTDQFSQMLFLDSSMLKLTAVSSYTYFEADLTYNGYPVADTVNISFASSNMADSTNYVGAGSLLYLDDLQIEYFPVAVEKNNLLNTAFSLYPNPAKNLIYMELNKDANDAALTIYDSRGQCVFEKIIPPQTTKTKIDVSFLNNGIYYYKVNSVTGKFVINR